MQQPLTKNPVVWKFEKFLAKSKAPDCSICQNEKDLHHFAYVHQQNDFKKFDSCQYIFVLNDKTDAGNYCLKTSNLYASYRQFLSNRKAFA
jgi:hypothetical protein